MHAYALLARLESVNGMIRQTIKHRVSRQEDEKRSIQSCEDFKSFKYCLKCSRVAKVK